MFLKLAGVPGNSTSPRHFGEIEIIGWSFGGNQGQQTLALGAQQGELGKNLLGDLTVSRIPDKSSQALMDALIAGKKFPEAVITIENISESGNLLRSMILKLKNVMITSFSSSNGSEAINLSFEKVEVMHRINAG